MLQSQEMKEVTCMPVIEEPFLERISGRRNEHISFDAFDKIILEACDEDESSHIEEPWREFDSATGPGASR